MDFFILANIVIFDDSATFSVFKWDEIMNNYYFQMSTPSESLQA